jgi:aminopeptidase N
LFAGAKPEETMKDIAAASIRSARRCAAWILVTIFVFTFLPLRTPADDPYPPSRTYDLTHARIHLSLDFDQREIIGDVTEEVTILQDNTATLKIDSAGLTISDVTVNGKSAEFKSTPNSLDVTLPHAAKRGEHFTVRIDYTGHPGKGLYFIGPNKNYPNQPKEVWSQGESEDTHFYIPIYDYPNDRLTFEVLLTVPANWITISNGRLAGVATGPAGTKTWDWIQAEPTSTYLISVVAGEFVEKKDIWRGVPLDYVVPRGKEDTIGVTFARTKDMLSLFSDKLNFKYPWAKYAQSAVDYFVAGGMENVSATTLTTSGLENPQLAPESVEGSDDLISHEMAHQWFGDTVTCKDWANIWLNEGFATYYEHLWNEAHYGPDSVAYEYWQDQSNWFEQSNLFPSPIVTYDSEGGFQSEGNIYTKGGWVLRMLREELGDEAFFRAMHDYLEANKFHNVVTADLIKAIDESSGVAVEPFFQQWVYGAGAPQFEVHSSYDAAAKKVQLHVQQTQKVEGRVGIFHVSISVEIATAAGRKDFPIDISKADETFSFSVDGPPLMILFDKGDQILKSVEFEKTPAQLIFQLQNADAVPDRADAAVALGEVKNNDAAVAALGEAALRDSFWGVRNGALRSLGRIGTPAAEQEVIAALANNQPWVRRIAVTELGHFSNDKTLGMRVENIAQSDRAWTVRSSALGALAALKTPSALSVLEAAVSTDSPDDILRRAALRAMGTLGDDKAVPALLEWSAVGQPVETRTAAIGGLGSLDKKNKAIEDHLIGYLDEDNLDIRFPAVFALVQRGDPAAIAPIEKLANSPDLSIGIRPFLEAQLERLKHPGAGRLGGMPSGEAAAASGGAPNAEVMQAIAKLQEQMTEINSRLARIESQIAKPKN